jgi:4'-phosphopantetheinyl transferase EntD
MQTLLSDLFDAAVVLEEVDLDYVVPEVVLLFSAERVTIQNALPARRREFIAGRVLARRAMRRLGHAMMAVPMGVDRAPIWPNDLTGSISHTPTWCAVAVAQKSFCKSIGIDIEEQGPFPPELWSTVCTLEEIKWLALLPEERREFAAKLIFSAKESAYKACYQIIRTAPDFRKISIDLAENGSWQAKVGVTGGEECAKEYTIGGKWIVSRGLVATGAMVGHEAGFCPSDCGSTTNPKFFQRASEIRR